MADMNFLPEDYLERRAQRRTNVLSLVLFVVVMGGVVAGFFQTNRQRTEVRQVRARVDAQFEEAAMQLSQLEKLQDRKQQMMTKAKVTATLLERVPRTLILAELVNRMPMSLSLLELDLTTKVIRDPKAAGRTALDRVKAAKAKAKKSGHEPGEPTEPTVKPTEVKINLVGVAPTDLEVAQFMSSLGESSLFSDLNLVFSQEEIVEKQKMRKFRVDMKVNQDLDISAFEPAKVARDLKHNPMDDRLKITTNGAAAPPPPANSNQAVPASNPAGRKPAKD